MEGSKKEMDAEARERVQSLLVQVVIRLQFLLFIDTLDCKDVRMSISVTARQI